MNKCVISGKCHHIMPFISLQWYVVCSKKWLYT